MFLDMAYTLAIVEQKALHQEFISRDCGGFFEHVWGVHPIADVPHDASLEYRGFHPSVTAFAANQTIVEGASAYYSWLRHVYPLNFLVSQLRFCLYLSGIVRREAVSVVVCTDPYLCGLYGLLLKLFTGAPLVVWVVANYEDVAQSTGRPIMPRLFKTRRVERWIEQIVFRYADMVAGGNSDNLAFALKNGARPERSTVFPVGKLIHPAHRVERASRMVDPCVPRDGAPVFAYVGRLIDTKFPDDVIRAFGVALNQIGRGALIMVGDGPMRHDLEALASELGLSNAIVFAGNVDQQRLADILGGCTVALSPLTGRALIEVALAGLAIVAYDRDWQKEFIDRSGGGRIVRFREWHEMGDVAARIASDPAVASDFGDSARRTGLEMCDLTSLYRHEQNVYRRLIQKEPLT
jgi:glycosyltransferase involved in cell wall biosynthesis